MADGIINKISNCSCVSGLPRTRRRRQPPSSTPIRRSSSNGQKHLALLLSITPSLTNCAPSRPNTPHLRSRRLPSHPYIPSWSSDTCTATRPAETWEATSSTLSDCCTKSFAWQVEDCIAKGSKLEEETKDQLEEDDVPKVYKYFPDWGARTCHNDKPPPNDWVDQYKTLAECCKTNFEWVYRSCLGDEYVEEEPAEAKTHWFPLWSGSRCVVHSDENPAPTYMTSDPENQMWPSFKTCCQSNFPDAVQKCKDASRLVAPPTRPPAGGATLVVIPATYGEYFYPRYTENRCLYDGEEAPGYMRRDPVTYLSLSAEECCRVQFPLNVDDCLSNSDVKPEDAGGGTYNEERWKDHYYPLFSKMGCINDNGYTEYMKESPTTFFFTTIELCCASNFELDYAYCVDNSVNVNDDGGDEMGQQPGAVGDGEKQKVPKLILYFGGRLYFQNVFIPSSNRVNMIAVRNEILNAVESAFPEEYEIEALIGKNFDGIDLTGLRRLSSGQGEHQEFAIDLTRLPPSSHGRHKRELARMQLFSFVIQFSIECGMDCVQDDNGKMFGRQVSLELAELFDDDIQDGSVFNTLKSSMEGKGLIGPFYSASLDDGALLYEKAELDMNGATFPPTPGPTTKTPTISPTWEPTPLASNIPSVSPSDSPTTATPTNSPTLSLSPTVHVVYRYYPKYEIGTCVADNQYSEFELNFYDTFEECCKFPWLIEEHCLALGSEPPTNSPTRRPTKKPSAAPTKRPSKSPTDAPTKNPITSSPTHSPVIATASPSNSPVTSSPTKNPVSRSPTQAPVSQSPTRSPVTTALVSESPTKSPTSAPTRRPTPGPTTPPEPCDNLWHISIEDDEPQTCTNSLNYPKAWEMRPELKAKMLLATPEQCCNENFSGKECNLINVCGGGTAGVEGTAESGCDSLWHLSIVEGDTCTNSDNYRKEWPEKMFYEDAETCCQYHFGRTCNMVDECSKHATTPPPDNSGTPVEQQTSCTNPWHMSTTGASDTCTNDKQYPAAWNNENIRPNTLFDTAEACCTKFFPGKECKKVDVCVATTITTSTTPLPQVTSPSQSNPTPSNGSSGECTNPWHIVTSGASNTCSNDDDYPASWNLEKIRVNQLHDTAEICCKKSFGDEVCHQINVCGDTVTTTSTGFYPVFKWPGCTNDDKAPAYMKEDPEDFYFKSIELCCSSGNFDVMDYDMCLERSVDVGPLTPTQATTPATKPNVNPTPATVPNSNPNPTPATAPSSNLPPGNCSNPWHMSTTGAQNTCTNDDVYPAAWNNVNLRPNFLFDTAEACCNKFFPGKECNQVNTCPPDTSGTISIKTTTTSTAAAASATTTSTAAASATTTSTAAAALTTTTTTTTTKNTLLLDWEDEIIYPGLVRFEGIGKWKIDETQPCCRTGSAIHNPILMPGEYSSMVIDYATTSSSGKIKFNYNMGLGTFSFFIDGASKLSVVVPGGGSKTFEASLGSGNHSFTWKFEPPGNSQLPLSHVWIDNVEIG